MCSALARKIKEQGNLQICGHQMRASIVTEPGEGQGGGGPPSQIRNFLKTRHEIVASGVILIDILEN